jgi:hypothetical protein
MSQQRGIGRVVNVPPVSTPSPTIPGAWFGIALLLARSRFHRSTNFSVIFPFKWTLGLPNESVSFAPLPRSG